MDKYIYILGWDAEDLTFVTTIEDEAIKKALDCKESIYVYKNCSTTLLAGFELISDAHSRLSEIKICEKYGLSLIKNVLIKRQKEYEERISIKEDKIRKKELEQLARLKAKYETDKTGD